MKKTNIFKTAIGFLVFVLLVSGTLSANHKHAKTSGYQVGQRVVLSDRDKPKPTAVDRRTWKLVTLHASQPTRSKENDEYTIKTLVPPEWFEAHKARIGSVVPLPLDLEDMGFDEDLRAKVVGIDPCPVIQNGPGRVVITTVKHFSRNVQELTATTPDRQTETIKQDSSYRFQSVDRADWVRIRDLKKGEKVRWLGDVVLTVVSVRSLPKAEDVYDLTVEPDHPYHVGLHHELTQPPKKPQPHPQPGPQHHAAPQPVKHADIPTRVWTNGVSGNRIQNALDHWNKHRNDFPQLKNEKEYIQYAYDFAQSAPMKKKRPNGDTVCFDPKSGTFGIVDKYGVMRTCFKPSGGLSYYEKQ